MKKVADRKAVAEEVKLELQSMEALRAEQLNLEFEINQLK